jgi:myo-inositol catabolism protein IolS
MELRSLGLSDIKITPILMGTWQAGKKIPPYSLFWRYVESDAMPYCIENNISILAYSPLAQGLLTGKFGLDHKFAEGDHRVKNKLFQGENYQRAQQALTQLRPIADRHHCTLGQLALAWLISQPQTNAIAEFRSAEQALDNAKAMDVQLSQEEIQKIDRIGRQVTEHIDDNPVMWNW